MKKYTLTIVYEDEGDVEFIEERIEKAENSLPEPSDTDLVHKCMTPFMGIDSHVYNDLIELSIEGGFIIGDA
ncbi:hypothetical protein CMI47_07105 [Candidatus Pacearchaeota archaeon]|jgi:hypothetical protein|nr:hypothetical protein [Candidatus Pacearchaeota archaeon]|tara:strand:- start:2918 stop:3133 length:216 start_codon:yes stop_codon:yes gene_type:complete